MQQKCYTQNGDINFEIDCKKRTCHTCVRSHTLLTDLIIIQTYNLLLERKKLLADWVSYSLEHQQCRQSYLEMLWGNFFADDILTLYDLIFKKKITKWVHPCK